MKNFVIQKIKTNKIYLRYQKENDSMLYILRRPVENESKGKLNYISVLPGSGKTHWSINKILSNKADTGYITLYVAPTVKLLREVYDSLVNKIEPDRALKLLCVEDNKSQVVLSVRFRNILSNASAGDVFLITHSLYSNLSDFPYGIKQKVSLIFDEASEFSIQHLGLKLDYDTALFFKDNVVAEVFLKNPENFLSLANKSVGETISYQDFFDYRKMYIPKAKQRQQTKIESAKTKRDNQAQKIIKTLKDPRFSVYAIEQKSKFSFFNFMAPDFAFSGISEVYLMSAFFELSELYHILSKHYELIDRSSEINYNRVAKIRRNYKNLRIVPITDSPRLLSSRLLKTSLSFPEGLSQKQIDEAEDELNLIRLIYAEKVSEHADMLVMSDLQTPDQLNIDEKTYEQHVKPFLRFRKEDVDIKYPIHKILDRALKVVNKIQSEKKPLLVVNSFQSCYVSNEVLDKVETISVKSHGLNAYSDKNILMFFVAMNPAPVVHRFYRDYIPNFSSAKQWVAATAIQAVARTSIRKTNNKEKVYLLVYSEGTAKIIQETLQLYLDYPVKIKRDKSIYYSPSYIMPYKWSRFFITGSSNKNQSDNNRFNQKSYLQEAGSKVTTEKVFLKHSSYSEIVKEYDAIRKKITRTKDEDEIDKLIEIKERLEYKRAKEKIKLADKYKYDYKPNAKTLKLIKDFEQKRKQG